MGQGENAGLNPHFLFFPQCFRKASFLRSLQRLSHLILIGAAKLSSESSNLCGSGGIVRKYFWKKWCDFVRIRVFFILNFIAFLRHFLRILSSDFIGAACCTNRKYWRGKCCTCCTTVYAHALKSGIVS